MRRKQRGADLPQLFPTSVFLDAEDSIHISTFNVTAVKKDQDRRTVKTSKPQGSMWTSSLLPF